MTWLRKDTAELGLVAVQLGMTAEEAVRALTIGGRFVALGYTDGMLWDMEHDYRDMRRKTYERGWSN